MYNFLDIIKGTPTWVWVVLGYLIIVGIKACYKSTVHLYQLMIMPIIFVSWSVYSLSKQPYSMTIAIWITCFIIGVWAGYQIMKRTKFEINFREKLITIPGSVIPLILSMSFFGVKYSLGVSAALNPVVTTSLLFKAIDVTVTGLISGISVGRVWIFAKQLYVRK